MQLDQHWDTIFATKRDGELGWYEGDVSQTLKVLGEVVEPAGLRVFLPGAGTSVLVDELLRRGHELILNDVSGEALRRLGDRIGPAGGGCVWLRHDISEPLPAGVPSCDLWIDRAVLHFLCEEDAIGRYFNNLRAVVRPGGHVLLAEFAVGGASMCAGLELHRYSLGEMEARLGDGFHLLRAEDYTFLGPGGVGLPYLYALFRRGGC